MGSGLAFCLFFLYHFHMARPLRIEYPGAFYHVTCRGNAQNDVFLFDGDRLRFMSLLKQCVDRFEWIVHAYCLMGNHYHLLVETPKGNLSRGMRHLNGVYTQWFNVVHERSGHLFQGRFHSILVEKDHYLLEVSRYIVLNPVRAHLVSAPEEWEWSSYRETAGFPVKRQSPLTPDEILSHFSSHLARSRLQYRTFVREGLGKKNPLDETAGGLLLGSEDFVARMKGLLEESNTTEHLKRERFAARASLQHIFSSRPRDKAMYEAVRHQGYTLREVGQYTGLHYSRVSRIVSGIDRKGKKTDTAI